MTDQVTLSAHSRPSTGSNVARRLRRQGRTPAVMYGHGAPQAISLDATEFSHKIATPQYGSQVVQLSLDGQAAGLALVKAVQVNTITHKVLSVDLLRVSGEDRIDVSVPVVLQGEPAERDGMLDQMVHAIGLRCRATDVPSEITYDISGLQIGDTVHAGQLAMPSASCELVDDPEKVIAAYAAPTLRVPEEEAVEITEQLTGPELTGESQQDDSQFAA